MVLPSPPEITEETRDLWMYKRRALIMELGAIEDYLDIPRSIPPKKKKVRQLDSNQLVKGTE